MTVQNWLDDGIDTVAVNGVPLTAQEDTINFIPGPGVTITAVDNPTTEQTDVTISTGAGVPTTPTRWTYAMGATCNIPATTNSRTWFDTTGGAISAQLPASPVDGVKATVKDTGRALATHPLSIVPSGSQKVEYPPGTVNAGGAAVVLNGADLGFGASWNFGVAENTWFIDA